MKSVLISCLFLTIGLVSCDDNEEPTTFRGEVIFSSGDERASNARVYISGTKSRGIGTPSDNVIDTLAILDQNYHFEVTLPAVDVQYYTLGIGILNANETLEEILLSGDGIECSECNSLEPGKSYDLTIEVLE